MKPNVRGLEDDEVGPAPEEEQGVDYSSPWHETYVHNKEEIRANLHTLHPSMQTVLVMCESTLGHMLLVDCSEYRYNIMSCISSAMVFDVVQNDRMMIMIILFTCYFCILIFKMFSLIIYMSYF